MNKILALFILVTLSGCDLFIPNDLKRFYAMEYLIEEKYFSNQIPEALSLTDEYLTLAGKYPDDWNYGNAIHKANLYKGLIALEYGKPDEAAAFLHASGNTPGSPQLDTFGPNMLLAKALLDHGHKQVVLEYIEQLRDFWGMHDGKLDQWKAQIENGENPNFGANLKY